MINKICFLVLISFTSCGLGPINRRGFDIYKEKVIQNQSETKLKTNGIFVKLSNNEISDGERGFYLYENGMYVMLHFQKNFWLSKENELLNRSLFSDKLNQFGHYSIKNDSIKIQYFWGNNNEFYSKQVGQYKGIILNDSIIKLTSNTFKNEESVIEEIFYKFYSTKIKSDSSQAWFLKKKWYQEELHESRK